MITQTQKNAKFLCGIFLAFWCLSSTLQAQKVIRGIVRNDETGETLSAATVQVENSYNGTVANSEGKFELRLVQIPATIIVRFIGYETVRLNVVESTKSDQVFRLKPISGEIASVEITAENPAIRIMKRVIAEKQRRQANLQTWQAEVYNRFVIKKDTAIVGIIERVTTAFWDKQRGVREVVKAKRDTENLKMLPAAIPAALNIANLYADDIELARFKLPGVTHPKAFDYYIFELVGKRNIDTQIVYDISVTPKDKLQPAFMGTISVVNEDFVLIEAKLKPNEAIFFTMPIKSFEYQATQQFREFKSNNHDDFWLPVDYRSQQAFELGIKGFNIPKFRIEQVSRFMDYAVNVPIPDSLFAPQSRRVRVDSVAVAKSDALKVEGLAVPLTIQEEVAYTKIDSTQTFEKTFQPTGKLARLLKVGERNGETDSKNIKNSRENNRNSKDEKPGKPSLFHTSPMAWYNKTEKIHVELTETYTLGKWKQGKLYAKVGYSSGLTNVNQAWSYGGGGSLFVDKLRRKKIEVSYEQGMNPRVISTAYSQMRASIIPMITDQDYFGDYFYNQKLHLRYTQFPDQKKKNNLQILTSIGLNIEKHYGYLPSILGFNQQVMIPSGNLNSVQMRIQYGMLAKKVSSIMTRNEKGLSLDIKTSDLTSRSNKGFLFEMEHANKATSDFNFTRFQAIGEWRFPTIYKRRFNPPALDIRAVAGFGLGETPPQRFGTLDGSLRGFSSFGTFKTQRNQLLEGDTYWAVFAEHHFKTIPFELLRMQKLVQKGTAISLHAAIGQTSVRSWKTPHSSPSPFRTGARTEIGASLYMPFGLPIRFDVTRSLQKDGGFFIGIGLPKVF